MNDDERREFVAETLREAIANRARPWEEVIAEASADVERMSPAEIEAMRQEVRLGLEASSHPRAFRVEYGVGESRPAAVDIGIGYGPVADADYQSIKLDDPRLPFTVESEFSQGLTMSHLEFHQRPGGAGLQQAMLRRGGIVSVLRAWARVARTIKRSEINMMLAKWTLSVDEQDDFDEVIAQTEKQLSHLMKSAGGASGDRSRKRGEEAEQLLERIVARYRELTEQGHPTPRTQIAEEENYHEAHIGRLLVKARKKKLLGPARIGKAGEITETEL